MSNGYILFLDNGQGAILQGYLGCVINKVGTTNVYYFGHDSTL